MIVPDISQTLRRYQGNLLWLVKNFITSKIVPVYQHYYYY